MRNYSKLLNQNPSVPILGRNDMVKNNAGGYVFQITEREQLIRFLLCGTENGTYYASQQTLTQENAQSIVSLIKSDGNLVVSTLLEYRNRVPKVDTVLFVLALVATHGCQSTKNTAYTAVSEICRTATHLFTFVSNVNTLRGWSAGLRKAVARWYTSKSDEKLSYQLVKYRNRAGFTHRDVLRLAHPKALTDGQNNLFKYAVDKISGLEVDSVFINAFTLAMSSADSKEIVGLIKTSNLTWEMIPTQFLNEVSVLEALLPNMPTQALIRNLGRFSKAKMTEGNTETTKLIKQKLSGEAIQKAGIHPINLVNSMLTYSKGKGDKGSSTWPVNQSIVDTLNEGYYAALKNVDPTGKDILIALDVSGSMNSAVGGTQLSATQLGAILAATTLRSEPNAEVIGFDTEVRDIALNRRTPIDQLVKAVTNGGGTDCTLAFSYAIQTKRKFDSIIILTDSETWAGNSHSLTLVETYRSKYNKDLKVIEIAMVANSSTLLPNDKNFLRIVGFDSAVPQLITEFLSK